MEIMEKLKSKGVLRAVGVSCHSLPALKNVISSPWADSVHARINPYGMSMDDSPDKAVINALPIIAPLAKFDVL